MYLNTRIFPTTGYARVLLFMFIRRELGGTGTGCLFQFTYCVDGHFKYTPYVRQNKESMCQVCWCLKQLESYFMLTVQMVF